MLESIPLSLLYSSVFIILSIVGISYYKVALSLRILDQPNERSSHSKPTIRGGGIIFVFAAIMWWIFSGFSNPWLIGGLLLVSGVSFLDDLYSLSRKIRFITQIIALSFLFIELEVFDQVHWIGILGLYFVSLGIINAINFMDGINGISVMYGFVFFISILAIDTYLPIFPNDLIYFILISLFVFSFFNLRKNALMFAGDIGSISLAYLVIFTLVKMYLAVGTWTVILLLFFYGIDTFVTLVQRLIAREKISLPHRKHLYQIMVNQSKMSHLLVSSIFAIMQLCFNLSLFLVPQSSPSGKISVVVLVLGITLYLGLKKNVTNIKKFIQIS